MPEPMLSLSMLILATYPVADIRPRSKPKSKLTSPNFNIVAFGAFWEFGAPLSTGGLGSTSCLIFWRFPIWKPNFGYHGQLLMAINEYYQAVNGY